MASPFMGPLRVTGREMRVFKTLYCRFKNVCGCQGFLGCLPA